MKRSEMINTIKDFFYDNDFYNFNDEHADLLLDKLERQGMRPPGYKAKAIIGFYSVDDWEPEDEE